MKSTDWCINLVHCPALAWPCIHVHVPAAGHNASSLVNATVLAMNGSFVRCVLVSTAVNNSTRVACINVSTALSSALQQHAGGRDDAVLLQPALSPVANNNTGGPGQRPLQQTEHFVPTNNTNNTMQGLTTQPSSLANSSTEAPAAAKDMQQVFDVDMPLEVDGGIQAPPPPPLPPPPPPPAAGDDNEALPSQDPLTFYWETAPLCAEQPSINNSVADTMARLWGFENGMSCAFRAADGSSLGYVGYIPVDWQVAPRCNATAPDANNSVADSAGRRWGWSAVGNNCAFKDEEGTAIPTSDAVLLPAGSSNGTADHAPPAASGAANAILPTAAGPASGDDMVHAASSDEVATIVPAAAAKTNLTVNETKPGTETDASELPCHSPADVLLHAAVRSVALPSLAFDLVLR
jgi:hypothetical protein